MSDREFRGKEDEKEYEKQEKDHEKSRGDWGYEKWRHDPLGSVVWAFILIWAGLALIAGNLGFWDGLRIGDSRVGNWTIVMVGAGVILLFEVVIRLVVPSYRQAVGGGPSSWPLFCWALVWGIFGVGGSWGR